MSGAKWRHEYKYIANSAQIAMLQGRATAVMRKDSHVVTSGSFAGIYNIRSVYFDDHYNTCYLENENGTDLREKFRIRIYNHSDERITLELKSRRAQKCLKRSCPLTREQCDCLIKGDVLPITDEQPFLLRKLITQMQTRGMRPVVIVEYDRIPFVHPLGNVRVTLDCNIRASNQCSSFFDPQLPLRPILQEGMHVAEVKWDEFLPDYIYQAMMLESLQWTSFSKFYLCRMYSAIEKTYK